MGHGDLRVMRGFAMQWWAFLIRGLFALVVGATTLVLPGLSLMTVVDLFGVYVLIDGLTTLLIGGRLRVWGLIVGGGLGLVVGVYILSVGVGIHRSDYPQLTAVALFYFIAAWAVIRGMLEIGSAMQLPADAGNRWVLISSGMVAVMLGFFFIASPLGLALRFIGAYGVLYGCMITIFALRVRKLRRFYLDSDLC